MQPPPAVRDVFSLSSNIIQLQCTEVVLKHGMTGLSVLFWFLIPLQLRVHAWKEASKLSLCSVDKMIGVQIQQSHEEGVLNTIDNIWQR